MAAHSLHSSDNHAMSTRGGGGEERREGRGELTDGGRSTSARTDSGGAAVRALPRSARCRKVRSARSPFLQPHVAHARLMCSRYTVAALWLSDKRWSPRTGTQPTRSTPPGALALGWCHPLDAVTCGAAPLCALSSRREAGRRGGVECFLCSNWLRLPCGDGRGSPVPLPSPFLPRASAHPPALFFCFRLARSSSHFHSSRPTSVCTAVVAHLCRTDPIPTPLHRLLRRARPWLAGCHVTPRRCAAGQDRAGARPQRGESPPPLPRWRLESLRYTLDSSGDQSAASTHGRRCSSVCSSSPCASRPNCPSTRRRARIRPLPQPLNRQPAAATMEWEST